MFHAPELQHEFFPGVLWFHDVAGGIFGIDRLMFVRLFVTTVLAVFFLVGMRNPKTVPTGLQNICESFLDFVRIHIAEEILGKKEGARFMPLLATIFFLVFANNLPSVIPGLNVSPNARVGLPLVLSIIGYVAFIYAGARRYGFFKFVKSSTVIPNVPVFLHILVVPLEFFSTFILRPVTLTLRLMFNMLVGHIILVLLFGATNFFVMQFNGWSAIGAVTIVAAIGFTFFELLVIVLQAYIFTLLSAVYIELALHADEH